MNHLTNSEGLALLSFIGRCPLRDEDYAPAMNIAKKGLVVWTVLPFAIIPQVTPEGRAAAIAFLDDEDVARELGLLDECPRTLRSGEYPATVPAAASGHEAAYLADIAKGMTIVSDEKRVETQRRIQAVAACEYGVAS